MVFLTSFKMAHKHKNKGTIYSIARFQPKGFSFPVLEFLAANDKYGNKLLLEQFIDPVSGYEKAYKEAIKARWGQIKPWLDSLDNNQDIVLCCWCPYTEHAKEQLKEFGTFVCHIGLIGKMINEYRPDIDVDMDDEHRNKLIKEWQPILIDGLIIF